MSANQTPSQTVIDNLVFIGRMQLFHYGQLHIVRKALEKGRNVIIVLGSAFQPRSKRNPFFADEREIAMRRALGELAARVKFIHMKDFNDNESWRDAVVEAVEALCEPGTSIGIIGHVKDETSFYLHMFPRWEQVLVENFNNLNATELRNLYFVKTNQAENHAKLADRVPPEVLQYLAEFAATAAFDECCDLYEPKQAKAA